MSVLEKTGKTVEEAVHAGALELGLPLDKIEYEIIEEPSKGLLGLFGGKPARVRLKAKKILAKDQAKVFLENVLSAMKVDVDIETIEHEEGLLFNLSGNNLGMLIGKHGQTLDALQYLTTLAAHRSSDDRIRITIDIEKYRERRAETLNSLAKRIAVQVKRRGERIALEPMNPNERKLIHLALQDDQRISTYSEGDEPHRRVVIALKR